MIQRYIPEIADGDKRVLLIAGEPVPFCARAHPEAGRDARQPGRGRARRRTTAHRARSARSRRALGPRLWADGLLVVGLDVIGDVPDRGERDVTDLLRGDRAADRLRRRRDVRRCAGRPDPAVTSGRGSLGTVPFSGSAVLQRAARRPNLGNAPPGVSSRRNDRRPHHRSRHAAREPRSGGDACAGRPSAAVRRAVGHLRRRPARHPAARQGGDRRASTPARASWSSPTSTARRRATSSAS